MSVLMYVDNFNKRNESVTYDFTEMQSEVAADTRYIFYITESLLLPSISIFGIVGNIITLIVLFKMDIVCSTYTYLTVLTGTDLGNLILILITCVFRQFYDAECTAKMEGFAIIPIAAIFSGIGVCATLLVTLDRLILLWNAQSPVKPKFCKPEIARRIMIICVMVSVLFNLPYFFVYEIRNNDLGRTPFFCSRSYFIYNWLRFALFGALPSILLPVGTALLVITIKRVSRQRRHLACIRKNYFIDCNQISFILIAIVVFFIIGEIPGHILSKKAAFIFIFDGDVTKEESGNLDLFRYVAVILGTLNCSINFVLYFMLHPPFCRVLTKMFSCKTKQAEKRNGMLVNVFVIYDKFNIANVGKVTQMLPDFVTWSSR